MNYATIAQFVIFEINVGLYLVYSKLLSLIIPKGHFFYKSNLKKSCRHEICIIFPLFSKVITFEIPQVDLTFKNIAHTAQIIVTEFLLSIFSKRSLPY